ncbi:hypothetical protein ACQKWADRAFT_284035 [Trichoderma austrokoningii]
MASWNPKKFMEKKMLQFDVTFGMYMFTPMEKFFFYSILFLLISLTSIAATLYLPQHISLLAGRAWYYINGETIDIAAFTRNVFDGALGAGKGAAAVVREL